MAPLQPDQKIRPDKKQNTDLNPEQAKTDKQS